MHKADRSHLQLGESSSLELVKRLKHAKSAKSKSLSEIRQSIPQKSLITNLNFFDLLNSRKGNRELSSEQLVKESIKKAEESTVQKMDIGHGETIKQRAFKVSSEKSMRSQERLQTQSRESSLEANDAYGHQ